MPLVPSRGNMYEFVTHCHSHLRGGCPHSCEYCLPTGTMILMADFTEKPIERIRKNDVIIGLSQEGRYYHFEKSVVKATVSRYAETIKIATDRGLLECTLNHLLLGDTGTRVSRWRRAGLFSSGDGIRFVGRHAPFSDDYDRGWLSGYVEGDGAFFEIKNKRDNYQGFGFEAVSVDADIRARLIDTARHYGIQLSTGTKTLSAKSYKPYSKYPMVSTRIAIAAQKLRDLTKYNFWGSRAYHTGYIGGMIDAEGSIGTDLIVRISNFDKDVLGRVGNSLKHLGLRYTVESSGIRVAGSFANRLTILFECHPACMRKTERLIIGHTVKNIPLATVLTTKAGNKTRVYNLETTTENYIANGFIVHNCYVRSFRNYQRDWTGPVRLLEKELSVNYGEGKTIFIEHCNDMFAEGVPDAFIEYILAHVELYPKNTYLFQTKNPARLLKWYGRLPSPAILGTTIETNFSVGQWSKAPHPRKRYEAMLELRHEIDDCFGYGQEGEPDKLMLTIEPIMKFNLDELSSWIIELKPDFINIGADSKHHGLPEPTKDEVMALVKVLGDNGITVNKKTNLERLVK